MARTVRDALLDAMENLTQRSFKRFRGKITDWDIEEGFKKIPKGLLEKAEAEDVVDLILNHYTNSYGPELMVDILNAIDEKQEALNLKKDLENVKGFTWRKKPEEELQSPEKFSSEESSAPQMHFVDKHREALIQSVPLVAPILDSLMSASLLTYEDYATILSEGTPFAQMRKLLYSHVSSWSDSQKDVLKSTLKKNCRALMENLEGPRA